MEYKGPYYYTLQLSGNEDKRVLSQKVYNGKVSNFKSPLTKKQTPKIYIVTHKNKIVYVGYASQSIGKRLGQGLRNSGVNKDLGYKWKQLLEVELFVFVFDKELKGNKNKDDKPFIDFAEAVEAEIVFLVRQNTGKWPEFQNEIHFNNSKNTTERDKVKAIALKIYTKITETQKSYKRV